MDKIDKYISEKRYKESLDECLRQNNYYLGLLIAYSINDKEYVDKISQTLYKINLEKFEVRES